MAEPLVSIVIPVYNGALYLAEALASAVGQEYGRLEVVVVDDGSTDSSASIAESFGGVRVIRQENQGVASARNRGVSEANGELLAFLDQDDIQLPKKTALQVAMLAAHPDAGMALCHKQYRIEGAPPAWFRGPTDGTAVPGFVPSCWLVRRETFERVGGFSPKFVTGCDYDWLARAKDLGITWATVPDVLVHYRVHGENESRHAASVKHDIVTYLRESLQRRRERAE